MVRSAAGEWPMYRADARHSGQATLAGNMHPPSVRWRWFVGGHARQVCAGDLDGDGRAELALVYGGGLSACRVDGTLLWRRTFPRGATLLYVEDVDRDGRTELICAADTPATLYVLDGTDGRLLHERAFADFQSIQAGHKLADLDGDGYPELVWFGNKAAQNAGENGYVLSFAQGAERPQGRWGGGPARHLYNLHYRPNVVVGDLDGDGKIELVVGSKGGEGRERARLTLAVFDGATGALRDVERHDGHRGYGALQLVDLDGDGRLEIAEVGFYQLVTVYPGPEGLRQRYSRVLHDARTAQDIAGPYGEGGKTLLLVQGTGGMEYGYDHHRQVFDFNPHGPAYAYVLAIDPVEARTVWDLQGHVLQGAADVDGDGVREVLVEREGVLKVFRRFAQTGERQGAIPCRVRAVDPPWMNNNYYPDTGTALIACDVDGDHCLEVLARLTESGALAWLDGLSLEVKHALADPVAEVLSTGHLEGGGLRLFAADEEGQVLVLDPLEGVQTRLETGGFAPAASVARLAPGRPPRVVVARRSGQRDCLDATVLENGGPRRCWSTRPDARPAVAPDWHVQPCLVDMEGRGEKVLLHVDREDGRLHLLDARGIAVRCFDLGPAATGLRILMPGHFADPVRQDIYAGTEYPMYGRHRSRLLHGLTGEVLWENVPGVSYLPVSADLRGTGLDDVAGMYYFTHTLIDGRTGATLFADPARPGYHLMSAIDVDGDSSLELICSGGYMTISCTRADGARCWAIDQLHYNAGGAAGIGDVDGDGSLELGVAFRDGRFTCYAAATGQERWTLPLPGAGTDCICGDVDGDGLPEFAFGCWDGHLYAVSGRGGRPTVLWKHPLGGTPGAPVMADADGDGQAEILIAGGDGYLYCLGAATPPLEDL